MAWYKTGTLAVTQGQTSVTGTGTRFASNARVGDGLSGPDGEWYEVVNIASETVLGIYPAYKGATISGSNTWTIAPLQGYNKETADRLRIITDNIRDFTADVAAAHQSAEDAMASQIAAKDSENASKTSELAAKVSETNADQSESNASVSEANALASADRADTAADNALVSQNEAADSATAALVSENASKTSENAAKVSETNSKTSELAAKASENAAAASEDNASTSETNAANSSTVASTAATTATNAATSANADADRSEQARDDAIAAAATVTGNLLDMGAVDLSSNTYPEKPVVSAFWKVQVGGTPTDNGETIEYGSGDTLVWSKPSEVFYKIDNTESVSSVAGKTGVVTLVKGDVGLNNVDNTSDVNKPVSTAQQTLIDLKINKTDIVDDLTSTDATKVLSAKQGKALLDLVAASNNTLKVFEYSATLGQTVFTGADIHGFTMVFQPGSGTIVSQNGVQLQITVDYTTTGTGTITLVKPVEQAGDLVQVQAFGTFAVANHYTIAEEDVLLSNKADKATTYTKTEADTLLATKVDKTSVIDIAHGGTGKSTAVREVRSTYIDGFILWYNDNTSITVTSGELVLFGSSIKSNYSGQLYSSGVVLAAQAIHYVYAYETTPGNLGIEFSLTAPVAVTGTAHQKTGDATRRLVGSYQTASSTVVPFMMTNDSFIIAVSPVLAPWQIVSAGTATTATAVTFTGAVPAHALTINLALVYSGATTGQTLSIHQLSFSGAASAMYAMPAATGLTTSGAFLHPLRPYRSLYYYVDGGSCYIRVTGYTFAR